MTLPSSADRSPALSRRVGVVTIGRNEGERLRGCLQSLLSQGAGPIVYVDSGSTDGSVELAESLGVEVVSLDMSQPFTMARGRNAGFYELLRRHPDLNIVQFVDGDCEVDAGWIATGLEVLEERPDVVAVCGFRRERYPSASVYNQLTDLEWLGPVGEIAACGGDAMYRVEPLKAAGGFNDTMIAGEEPELCVRLRQAGWKIWRVDAPMTRHDAALTHFGQWWRRALRSGHASAEGMALHGASPERHKVKETLSALAYGLIFPAAGVLAAGGAVIGLATGALPVAVVSTGAFTALGLIYARLAVSIYRSRRRIGDSPKLAVLYTRFCVLGKVPESFGILKYAANRLRGRRSGLIEYKTSAQQPSRA